MKFIPLYDRILVLPLNQERKVDGITLPQIAGEKEEKIGVIVSVGEGYVSESGDVRPLRVKSGDTVLYGPYSGRPIQIDETEFWILREAELSGILQDDPPSNIILTDVHIESSAKENS